MPLIEKKFFSEEVLANELVKDSDFLNKSSIEANAIKIIELCRERRNERTQLDAFLSEYGLSNNEGVASGWPRHEPLDMF